MAEPRQARMRPNSFMELKDIFIINILRNFTFLPFPTKENASSVSDFHKIKNVAIHQKCVMAETNPASRLPDFQ